jgi:hypothetical protein
VVKDINVNDLALIELLNQGETEAPRGVLDQLAAQGFVTVSGGVAKLTQDGRERARKLKAAEGSIRAMARTWATSGTALKSVGGNSIHG